MMTVQDIQKDVGSTENDRIISYLPYPHGFEQCLFAMCCMYGCKIGYYQGNPLKLIDDCSLFKPTIFPSVPRLFNKIYGKIKDNFSQLTGCKGWLVNKAVEAKTANLVADPRNAQYASGCYDMLVMNKVKALLGGHVNLMITGSAPIDVEVMNFLKICFGCPIVEGYGLTETSGASNATLVRDPLAGHVGGPLPACKLRLRDVPEMSYLHTDKPYPRGEV
jgi:long-chain acyl-CoA synthetase